MKWYIQKTQFEKEEFDTRNIFPDIFSTIEITGDYTKILNKEQFDYLVKNNIISEITYDCDMCTLLLSNLFTAEDIKKKIEEIYKGD